MLLNDLVLPVETESRSGWLLIDIDIVPLSYVVVECYVDLYILHRFTGFDLFNRGNFILQSARSRFRGFKFVEGYDDFLSINKQ